MQGIVMDIKGKDLIIMTKDGQFIEIKNYKNKTEIGQEITYNDSKVLRFNQGFIRRAVATAAAFLIMIISGYGVYGYYAPFGYVDVDINPSVELSYNLYDRVISIKGLNEDGNSIITKISDYKNKPVKEIVTKVIEAAIEEKYIKEEEENAILVTVTESGSKINDEELFQTVDNQIKEQDINAEVLLIKSDEESYKAAKENNLSPGKQMIINKALGSNDDIDDEDIKDKSVKEIMAIIKENKKENKEQAKEEKFGIKYQNKLSKEAEKGNKDDDSDDDDDDDDKVENRNSNNKNSNNKNSNKNSNKNPNSNKNNSSKSNSKNNDDNDDNDYKDEDDGDDDEKFGKDKENNKNNNKNKDDKDDKKEKKNNKDNNKNNGNRNKNDDDDEDDDDDDDRDDD